MAIIIVGWLCVAGLEFRRFMQGISERDINRASYLIGAGPVKN
jgi:hypothetical protein